MHLAMNLKNKVEASELLGMTQLLKPTKSSF
jgi:hypothetical protein